MMHEAPGRSGLAIISECDTIDGNDWDVALGHIIAATSRGIARAFCNEESFCDRLERALLWGETHPSERDTMAAFEAGGRGV